MRYKFTGPEGAAFVGQEIPAVTLEDADLIHVAALQRGTGLKMKDLVEQANDNDTFGTMCVLFLSLHSAGHPLSFDKVEKLKMRDIEGVPEPGDEGFEDDAEDDAEDPTTPSTASAPAVDGEQSQHSA